MKDRERLRALAEKQLEYAHCKRNDDILKQWHSLAQGKRETPTVRLLFSNFCDEVITPRLQCEGEEARQLEWGLLSNLVGRELFDDDTPIPDTFNLFRTAYVIPFGLQEHITRTEGGKSKGFHIDPVIEDLSEDLNKLRGGSFHVDHADTDRRVQFAQDMIGDLLPVRLVQPSLRGLLTYPLVHLMGMENYYLAMYDTPDELHEAMEMATQIHEAYFDYLEKEKFLLPTKDFSPVAQETFAFNSELPRDHVTKTQECWGFLESQETTAVAPEMYGEFAYPYLDRLARRMGLLSYGCCERVDALWEKYLSKWPNLRKLSVSPFNDEKRIGEYLRGTNVIYYSKPRAEFVTNPGPLDEAALRTYFKGVCEAASGCLFEMAQREVGTIYGDFERGRKYVQIARECIAEYWKP